MSGYTPPPEGIDDIGIVRRWLQGIARRMFTIPQYSSDPATVNAQDVWVLYTSGTGTYQLSYRTKEGTTKRVTIS